MKEKFKTKLFLFDTETTGLDPNKDQILTLYGIILDGDTFEIIDSIDLKIKSPFYHVDIEAIKVNKINLLEHSNDASAVHASKALEIINSTLNKHFKGELLIPVGWNIDFDLKFLKALGEVHFLNRRTMDLHPIVTFLIYADKIDLTPGSRLEVVCNYFNIPTKDHHNAKYDVQMTYELLKILYQKVKTHCLFFAPKV